VGAAFVVDGEGFVVPVGQRVETLEPRHAEDNVKIALQVGGVEGFVVGVRAEGEAVGWEEEGTELDGAIGKEDSVGCVFGSCMDVMTV
jgi:hypothetical protein